MIIIDIRIFLNDESDQNNFDIRRKDGANFFKDMYLKLKFDAKHRAAGNILYVGKRLVNLGLFGFFNIYKLTIRFEKFIKIENIHVPALV